MLDGESLDQMDAAVGPDRVAELAAAMIEQARAAMDRLAAAASAEDRRDIAHSAKGSAASLGAAELAARFAAIEAGGDIDAERLDATIAATRQAYAARYPALSKAGYPAS
jgi:HPt (histidine-containing phosphotransfer) domain-containing protein